MRHRLKQIIESNATWQGRLFDKTLTVLILVSVLTFSAETVPNLSPLLTRILAVTEWAIVIFFTFEYLARIYVADKPTAYMRSFWGIIDLLAILPSYLSAGVGLASLRSIRLLRLFKLARYSQAVRRLHRAILIAKEESILFFVMTVLTLYLSAVGIYYFEHQAQPEVFSSVFHSLWWAVTTLTTVGYGDAYPITAGGRIFTFCVLMIGLGIVAVPAGLVASALGKARQLEDEESSQRGASTSDDEA